MLPRNFQPFVNARPICVLARATLEHLFDPQELDELFVRTAEKQYTRTLLFSWCPIPLSARSVYPLRQ